MGLADTFALVVGPGATDAATFLSSNCSMRARLRATFASRSSSLFLAYLANSLERKSRNVLGSLGHV